jgi:peroxiredoxin
MTDSKKATTTSRKTDSRKVEERKGAGPEVPRAGSPNASPVGMLLQLGFVAVAALLVYSFVSVAKDSEMRRKCAPLCLLKPEYAGAEKTVPDFTLKDLKGKDVAFSSYRGKVVVLNFWTKTCGPCMEEMPDLYDLARILKGRKDVELVTISADDSAEDAERTLRANFREDPPFTVLMDPDLKVIKGKFGTSLYPETWIIDATGTIRARFDGKRQWTSGLVTQFIEQIHQGSYCPLDIQKGEKTGTGKRICDAIGNGS